MKMLNLAAFAAGAAALTLAGAADAKPNKHNKVWDAQHQRWVEANWSPPGLAKKPYGMPPGQAKKMHKYARGQHLPQTYYSNRTYYVTQPRAYNLRTAPPGYQWVRVGDDAYLTQTRTGLIADVIANLIR